MLLAAHIDSHQTRKSISSWWKNYPIPSPIPLVNSKLLVGDQTFNRLVGSIFNSTEAVYAQHQLWAVQVMRNNLVFFKKMVGTTSR